MLAERELRKHRCCFTGHRPGAGVPCCGFYGETGPLGEKGRGGPWVSRGLGVGPLF